MKTYLQVDRVRFELTCRVPSWVHKLHVFGDREVSEMKYYSENVVCNVNENYHSITLCTDLHWQVHTHYFSLFPIEFTLVVKEIK